MERWKEQVLSMKGWKIAVLSIAVFMYLVVAGVYYAAVRNPSLSIHTDAGRTDALDSALMAAAWPVCLPVSLGIRAYNTQNK